MSLRPLLEDPSKKLKDAAYTQLRRGNFDGYSIRTERYRFTQWDGGKKGEQLFDMQNDPGETKNLIDSKEHSEIIAQLREKLGQYSK